MGRLVVDTNSLIQCISRRSRYHELWLSFFDGRNQLCVTTEILEEYSEIISGKASPQFAQLAIEAILNNPYTLMITPYYKFGLISADPDDNKFVDCAIAANAQYIVTDDHHYNVLNTIEFPKVSVIKLDAIMEML